MKKRRNSDFNKWVNNEWKPSVMKIMTLDWRKFSFIRRTKEVFENVEAQKTKDKGKKEKEKEGQDKWNRKRGNEKKKKREEKN